MLSDAASSAFQTAANIAPSEISNFIRTVILCATFVWAAWCLYSEVEQFKDGGREFHQVLGKWMRVLFIVVIMMGLVYVA